MEGTYDAQKLLLGNVVRITFTLVYVFVCYLQPSGQTLLIVPTLGSQLGRVGCVSTPKYTNYGVKF